MRMRKKKHLSDRMAACAKCLIPTDCTERNTQKAIEQKEYIDWNKEFGNDHKVELEIGCGKGQFLCEMAKRYPDRNFVGVERITNVIISAMEKVTELDLHNVKFLNINALILPKYIKSDSIDTIHLNFSNPLPQQPSKNLRLTSARFLTMYKDFLVKGGKVHQKTDDMHFFEFSIVQFSNCGFTLKNIILDLHKSQDVGNIVTEHEYKFSQMDLPIYKLTASLDCK